MKYLLFVPAPAHRDALLGEGAGGARPPVAVPNPGEVACHTQGAYPHDRECAYCAEDWPCNQPDRIVRPPGWKLAAGWEWERKGAGRPAYPPNGAIVLVWQGIVAVEGCDRLGRTFLTVADATVPWIPRSPDVADAANLASNAQAAGLGTVVVVED